MYLESKAGVPSLGFGGTQGRQLQMGDWIELARETKSWAETSIEYTLPDERSPN